MVGWDGARLKSPSTTAEVARNLRQVWVSPSLVARMPKVRVSAPASALFWTPASTLNASYASGQPLEDQPWAKDCQSSFVDQLGCAFQVVPDEMEPVCQNWNSRAVQDQEWLFLTLKVARVNFAPS